MFPFLNASERDWEFISEPNPGLNGRQLVFPRGKCLGGSSAINYMLLAYPSRMGIDGWADFGNKDWNWDGLAPYFRKFVTQCTPPKELAKTLSIDELPDEVQQGGGPIQGSHVEEVHPTESAWVDTWKALGKGYAGDQLAEAYTGGFANRCSIDPVTKQRSHAGNAYLGSALERSNLHVVTGALIDKVELEDRGKDGVVATGVTFTTQGSSYTAHADKEVVVCAGAFGSPAILERSGIGKKSLLESFGIKSVIDNPNVGENLQDHAMCGITLELDDGTPSYDMTDNAFIQQQLEAYQTSKTGVFTRAAGMTFAHTPLVNFIGPENTSEELNKLLDRYLTPASPSQKNPTAEQIFHAFFRRMLSNPEEATGSICYGILQLEGHKLKPADAFAPLVPGNFTTLLPQLAHPFSRGSVHLKSADPEDYPRVDSNFLSHPLDVEIYARHMMQSETFAQTPPFSNMLKKGGRRLQEGHDALTLERARDLVRHSSMSNYHPCGTCAMMSEALGGVVDDRLVVHGTRNLRVCDASVFPIQVRGNIQSTVYAVAEKGADILKEDLRK